MKQFLQCDVVMCNSIESGLRANGDMFVVMICIVFCLAWNY